MSVLQDSSPHLIQGGHVDELPLEETVAGLLHSVWVALNIVEYVAEHKLIGGV